MLKVSIAIASPREQAVLDLSLPEGSTVADALEAARSHPAFAGIDAKACRVGIWSRRCELATPLRPGDRVEVYRPLVADPKRMRRARAKLSPSTRSRNAP